MSYNVTEKQKIIFEHYLKPNNKDNKNHSYKIYGSSCADYMEYDFEIKNNILKNIKFNGTGCSFFMAASDLLINQIKNKKIDEIIYFIDKYEKFINGEIISETDLKNLNELNVFDNLHKQENRKTCALTLAWDLRSRLTKNEKK